MHNTKADNLTRHSPTSNQHAQQRDKVIHKSSESGFLQIEHTFSNKTSQNLSFSNRHELSKNADQPKAVDDIQTSTSKYLQKISQLKHTESSRSKDISQELPNSWNEPRPPKHPRLADMLQNITSPSALKDHANSLMKDKWLNISEQDIIGAASSSVDKSISGSGAYRKNMDQYVKMAKSSVTQASSV